MRGPNRKPCGNNWSIACSPARTTANAGAGTGSTSFAMPKPRASSTTASARRLALPRLCHPGVQRRQALRPLPARTTRRRRDRATPNHENLVAAGFHRLGPVRRNAGNKNLAFSRNEVLTEMTDAIGAAFLGLTVGCARCHDHSSTTISQKDYYRLQAFSPRRTNTISSSAAAEDQADWKDTHREDSRSRSSSCRSRSQARMPTSPGPEAKIAELRRTPARSRCRRSARCSNVATERTPIHVLKRGDPDKQGDSGRSARPVARCCRRTPRSCPPTSPNPRTPLAHGSPIPTIRSRAARLGQSRLAVSFRPRHRRHRQRFRRQRLGAEPSGTARLPGQRFVATAGASSRCTA